MNHTEQGAAATRETLDATLAQLRRYVPALATYLDTSDTLSEHSVGLRAGPPAPEHRRRLGILVRAARRVAGKTFAGRVGHPHLKIEDVAAVNIVDHHQLLNHPLLLGTNVNANASRLLDAGSPRPIVCFSCSNISPSNYYLRNGFTFRGQAVPYFGTKEYQDSMYFTPAREFDFVARLRQLNRWSSFQEEDQEFLTSYETMLNGLDHPSTNRHKDQVAVAVRASWSMLFDRTIRDQVPELLYLASEDVTRLGLIEVLADDNFLADGFLKAKFRQQVLDRFRGTVTAWDEAAGRGTHFFWRRRPGQPRLLRMYVQGEWLVPTDQRFEKLKVPLRREALLDHLIRDEIVPAVSTSVSLFLYCGMKPLVGPGSLVYFSQFQQGWTELLAQQGLTDEAALISSVQTNGLIAGTPIFFARGENGLRTQFGADVMADGGVDRGYLSAILRRKFADILSVGASGMYDLFASSYIPKEHQIQGRVGFDDAANIVHQWIEDSS